MTVTPCVIVMFGRGDMLVQSEYVTVVYEVVGVVAFCARAPVAATAAAAACLTFMMKWYYC